MVDRSRRVAAEIQRCIAPLLRDLKDPRVGGMVTISGVQVSKDLSAAKIYFTLLQVTDVLVVTEGLQHAAGYLGVQLAKSIKLRKTPRLYFHYDDSLDQGKRIEDLLAGMPAVEIGL